MKRESLESDTWVILLRRSSLGLSVRYEDVIFMVYTTTYVLKKVKRLVMLHKIGISKIESKGYYKWQIRLWIFLSKEND